MWKNVDKKANPLFEREPCCFFHLNFFIWPKWPSCRGPCKYEAQIFNNHFIFMVNYWNQNVEIWWFFFVLGGHLWRLKLSNYTSFSFLNFFILFFSNISPIKNVFFLTNYWHCKPLCMALGLNLFGPTSISNDYIPFVLGLDMSLCFFPISFVWSWSLKLSFSTSGAIHLVCVA
jgi:hypothetical protein